MRKLHVYLAFFALLFAFKASAMTFVYVSNAEDGDIGLYTLRPDGALAPGQRFKTYDAKAR